MYKVTKSTIYQTRAIIIVPKFKTLYITFAI